MVIHNLNVNGIGANPAETNTPLVVDPNALLPRSFARQGFQTIASNHAQIRQGDRRMNLVQLPFCHRCNSLEFAAELAPEDLLGLSVPE